MSDARLTRRSCPGELARALMNVSTSRSIPSRFPATEKFSKHQLLGSPSIVDEPHVPNVGNVSLLASQPPTTTIGVSWRRDQPKELNYRLHLILKYRDGISCYFRHRSCTDVVYAEVNGLFWTKQYLLYHLNLMVLGSDIAETNYCSIHTPHFFYRT